MHGNTSARHWGILLCLGAVLAWSTAGLFVRLVDLDAWTVLFWRGLFACPATCPRALDPPAGDPRAAARTGAGSGHYITGHGKDSHQILTHQVGVEDGDGAMRCWLEAVR